MTTTKVRSQPLKISSQLELLTIYRIEILSTTFLEKKLERMVGTYTPSIAPLKAPVSYCGMGLGRVEASTAGRNEVWKRGVVGGRYSALPKLVTQKLRLDRERALLLRAPPSSENHENTVGEMILLVEEHCRRRAGLDKGAGKGGGVAPS